MSGDGFCIIVLICFVGVRSTFYLCVVTMGYITSAKCLLAVWEHEAPRWMRTIYASVVACALMMLCGSEIFLPLFPNMHAHLHLFYLVAFLMLSGGETK